MSVDFASQISLQQSGANRLYGASAMLMPNTPAFSAYGTAGVVNEGQYVNYNGVAYDVGGGFNPGNGIYSAPVGGIYYFFAHFLGENDGTAYEHRHAIYKNGGWYAGGVYIQLKSTAYGWFTFYAGGHFQMAAGDYVGMYRIQGRPSHNNGSYYGFGGHLVA